MDTPRRRYRYRPWVKIVFWSSILLVIFSIGIKVSERPATGTIIKTVRPSSTETNDTSNSTLTAQFFTLTYDATLDAVNDISSGDQTALEVFRIARSEAAGRRTVVITIKNLPPDGVLGESSYRIRQNNPKDYKEKTATYGETAFITMQKSDGSELTAFTNYGGKLAMVSYALGAPGADLEAEAAALLSQFRWLK